MSVQYKTSQSISLHWVTKDEQDSSHNNNGLPKELNSLPVDFAAQLKLY